ncbi:MAG TPA: dihydrofolate reductase family protein [Gemmatimonadaceae bacterium]|nr:dihydrofolate reductase family protein [Gemmatimonadaceae bacterium]
MTRTLYYTAASLDGFIADASNSVEWLNQLGDPEGGDYEGFIRDVGAVAMGSTTYEWILANHVHADPSAPRAWPYSQPSWVFSSHDLPGVQGATIHFVRGDVRPVHAEMVRAAAGKNIWLVGGGDLVGQFYDHGLLDEMLVTVASVTLGAGAPLLPRTITRPPLRLLSATAWGESFVRLHYQVLHPRE